MISQIPPLGIMQGRLTPSPDGSIQFFPKDNWRNEFGIASKIGFDCIELLVKKDSYEHSPLWVGRAVRETKQLSQASQLAVFSTHCFYDKGTFYSGLLWRLIIGASYLGAKTMLISFFDQNALAGQHDKELAKKQLEPVLELCKTVNVRLGIETEMAAPELLEFVRSFNHPNVGVYYDIGNMASMGVDVAKEIRFLGDLICGVHVKDRLASGGKTVPFGEGCADFGAAFAALHDIGYKGPFIIQGARVVGVDDVELNGQYYRFCKKLLEKTYGGGKQ